MTAVTSKYARQEEYYDGIGSENVGRISRENAVTCGEQCVVDVGTADVAPESIERSRLDRLPRKTKKYEKVRKIVQYAHKFLER